MARAAAEQLGDAPAGGIVLGPAELVGGLDFGGVSAMEVDHPLATERNAFAAREVEALVGSLGTGDTLLVLISGGASAHLTLPSEGVSLEGLRSATDELLRAGTTIDELNCVRKHSERLKGGRLAALASPARVVVLVLSDVVGDRLDVIGSGPAAADPSTYADALHVLEQRGVASRCAEVARHLERGVRGEIEETPKPGDVRLKGVETTIIGSRATAVGAARAWALGCGFEVVDVNAEVVGESAAVGRALARRALDHGGRAAAWIIGGETTVSGVTPGALGGPAQELALAGAIELEGAARSMLVSFATDGIDGPTSSAGAWVTGETVAAMRRKGLDAPAALASHQSHRALEASSSLITTGPTGTNVNDIGVLLVYS
jgi:glycerate-2-kinase